MTDGHDRQALAPLFEPRSIVVVGASPDPTKLSNVPLRLLREHGYAGRLDSINPKYTDIDGVPCWPSLTAMPERPDLAMLMLPPEAAIQATAEAAGLGVPAVIVSAAGFAEIGPAGLQLQQRLQGVLAGSATRMLGPNCMGVVNLGRHMAATFSAALTARPALTGHTAFIGQSGAIAGCVMDMARARQLGLSHWVSTGNEADIDVTACAEYLIEDPDVQVLCLYIEQLRDPARYLEVARTATKLGKTLIVLKGGRSASGARAAISHTGSLTGSDRVFRAASLQAGVILVEDIDEMLSVAAAGLLPRPARGPGVAVVSTSGAAGVILSDLAEQAGLGVPDFGAATVTALEAIAPAHSALRNPADLTAGILTHLAEGRTTWYDACRVVAADDSVDVLICAVTMVTGASAGRLVEQIVAAANDIDKPLLVCWFGGELCAEFMADLRRRGVPTSFSAALTMRSAAALMATPAGDRRLGLPRPARARRSMIW